MSPSKASMARPPRRRGNNKILSNLLGGNNNVQSRSAEFSPGQNMARSSGRGSRNMTTIIIVAFGIVSLTTIIIAGVLLFNTLFGNSPTSAYVEEPAIEQDVEVPQGAQFEKPLDKSGSNSKAWDGKGRVNVLVMGLDYREGDGTNGAARTDSMILFTMDPSTSTAGMLSIPRDLSVSIPGYGDAKINTAYFLGAAYNSGGGGPALAVKSVEGFIQEPINYYVVINWDAFVKFIDTIGGVDIKVPDDIKIGLVDSGHSTILRKGTQTLDGATALAYARARDTEQGDFDRSKRQQQVIMAVRDNILNYYSLPKLVTKAPALYSLLAKGFNTNLSIQQGVILALEAKKIPEKNILREVVNEGEEVYATFNTEGQYVLMPIPEAMVKLRTNLFHPAVVAAVEPAQPPPAETTKTAGKQPTNVKGAKPVEVKPEELKPSATPDPLAVMKAEDARISVQNGTGVSGLAGKTAELLKKKGFNVVEETNAPDLYQLTEIHCGSQKTETIRRLAEMFKIPSSRIFSQNIDQVENGANLVLILGSEWADSQ